MISRLLPAVLALILALPAHAIERKPVAEVEADALTTETQLRLGGTSQHISVVWWVPTEYWELFLSRDQSIGAEVRQQVLDTLSGVSLLAVVQADISPLGVFDFYSEAQVREGLILTYEPAKGESRQLKPLTKVDPGLQILIGQIKPVLTAAMGNLGGNMHFLVLDDEDGDGQRILDPYLEGVLSASVTTQADEVLGGVFEFPLDSLFVPRKCPNGKDAHVSWRYCPWSGEELAR
ncbi:MAG: hypothetical protein AAFX85_14495 [Pseudomonadota bacterium]